VSKESIIIFGTPRSGTTALCHALSQVGYVNQCEALSRHAIEKTGRNIIADVFTPDRVVIKANILHTAIKEDGFESIEPITGKQTIVWMQRDAKVRQAVSFAIAARTKVFAVFKRPPPFPFHEEYYILEDQLEQHRTVRQQLIKDENALMQMAMRAVRHMEFIRPHVVEQEDLFVKHGVSPLRITHESFFADPKGAVKQITGADLPEVDFITVSQADDLNDFLTDICEDVLSQGEKNDIQPSNGPTGS